MVPFQSETVRIGGVDMVVEATLNNCSSVWTAVVLSESKLVASGAGSSTQAAIKSAIERAGQALASQTAR